MPANNQSSNTAGTGDVKPMGRVLHSTRYRMAMEKQGLTSVVEDQNAGGGLLPGIKRKADVSPLKHEQGTKRFALGNLTNAEASAGNIVATAQPTAVSSGFLKNKTINKLPKPLSQMVQQLTIRNRNCDGKKSSNKQVAQSHMYTKPDINGPEIKGPTKILTRAAMRQQQAQKATTNGSTKENAQPLEKLSTVGESHSKTVAEPQKQPVQQQPPKTRALEVKRTNVEVGPSMTKNEPKKKHSGALSPPPVPAPTVGVNKVKTRLSNDFESDNSLYVTALDISNEDAVTRIPEAASNVLGARVPVTKVQANGGTKKAVPTVLPTVGPSVTRKSSDALNDTDDNSAQRPVAEVRNAESVKDVKPIVVADEEPKLKVYECSPRKRTPEGVEDFDLANWNDIYQVSHYAQDIFEYLRERERVYVVPDYIERQPFVTKWMRAVLVDWMVEIQESFELNHETLYLAVKIVDIYLSLVVIQRELLQLVAAAALLIAAKYDERVPPTVDDFIYICDGAYERPELIKMERTVFHAIGYDIGIPLSYRFLRRYARVNRIPMPILTLARYILETSLMEYATIQMLDSKLACAALFIALRMSNKPGWNETLEYYSGYKVADFKEVTITLNSCMMHPKSTLNTVRQKYSHELFFGVAKRPVITSLAKLFEGALEEDAVFKLPTAISTSGGGEDRETIKRGSD
ncbi:G2/mitotic-specific cyclin-B3 [Anopheles bellator]|uniref:G2/mitotic-specific cyclin-B3 n=1 Tax=Anopheles bellator TaxID=139047 RepID=UPI00264978D5|nr:G2/mitotic-specific cyclin-B3 [Anopheles bellator]